MTKGKPVPSDYEAPSVEDISPDTADGLAVTGAGATGR